jgi:hypothetical protein
MRKGKGQISQKGKRDEEELAHNGAFTSISYVGHLCDPFRFTLRVLARKSSLANWEYSSGGAARSVITSLARAYQRDGRFQSCCE